MQPCKICDSADARITVSLDIDGVSEDMAFCQECANKFELDMDTLERKGLPDFLGRCMAFVRQGDCVESKGLVCPNCGLTTEEVLNSGKAGCAFCYIIFRDLPVHKTPAVNQRLDELVSEDCASNGESPEILERLLQEAISEEDYESAAQLRDKLRDANGSFNDS